MPFLGDNRFFRFFVLVFTLVVMSDTGVRVNSLTAPSDPLDPVFEIFFFCFVFTNGVIIATFSVVELGARRRRGQELQLPKLSKTIQKLSLSANSFSPIVEKLGEGFCNSISGTIA